MIIDKQSIEANTKALVDQALEVIAVAQELHQDGILDKESFLSICQQAEDGYPTFAAFEITRTMAKQQFNEQALHDKLLLITNEAA